MSARQDILVYEMPLAYYLPNLRQPLADVATAADVRPS